MLAHLHRGTPAANSDSQCCQLAVTLCWCTCISSRSKLHHLSLQQRKPLLACWGSIAGLEAKKHSTQTVCPAQVAVELCWRTCISSRSNGEELARSGGVEALGALLARCCAVLTREAAPTAPAALIAAHALRALAGMAAFPHAQAELLLRCLES